jgi:hypothetical protein
MTQVIEVPGMGNVEFPDDMSEKDIADAIDAELASQHSEKMSNASAMDVGTAMAIPAAAAAVPAVSRTVAAIPEGLDTAKKIATPGGKAFADLARTYMNKPGAAFTDLALTHMGLPPINAADAAKTGVQGTYDQLRDWRQGQGQFAPKTPSANPTGAVIPPATDEAQRVISQMHPDELAHFNQNGMDWKSVPQRLGGSAPNRIPTTPPVGGPAAAEGSNFLQSIAQKYGQVSSKIGQVAGQIAENPMMQGVAKVAGPIINNPVTRFAGSRVGGGIQAALYPSDLGPPVPTTGPLRGSEINPATRRPWTAQELAQYRAQYR